MKGVTISVYENDVYASSQAPPTIYECNKEQCIEYSQSKHRKSVSWTNREQKFQGAKVLGSELAGVLLALSLQGVNWSGSEKAWYPILLTKPFSLRCTV